MSSLWRSVWGVHVCNTPGHLLDITLLQGSGPVCVFLPLFSTQPQGCTLCSDRAIRGDPAFFLSLPQKANSPRLHRFARTQGFASCPLDRTAGWLYGEALCAFGENVLQRAWRLHDELGWCWSGDLPSRCCCSADAIDMRSCLIFLIPFKEILEFGGGCIRRLGFKFTGWTDFSSCTVRCVKRSLGYTCAHDGKFLLSNITEQIRERAQI